MARAAGSKSSSFNGAAGSRVGGGTASAMRPIVAFLGWRCRAGVPFNKMDVADRERLLARLRDVVGERYAFADPYEMRLYQYDASPETALPDIVALPGSSEEVAQIVKICADARVPIT